MILSDSDIKEYLRQGSTLIEGLDPECIQPASVDVRLAHVILWQRNSHAEYDTRNPPPEAMGPPQHLSPAGFVLYPGQFCLGSTVERVNVPSDLVVQVNGRSSLGRLGIIVHATAGFVDPGFSGNVTLEMSNVGGRPVRLYPGQRVAQLVFCKLYSPCDVPYGPTRGSKYLGAAAQGAQPSLIGKEGRE